MKTKKITKLILVTVILIAAIILLTGGKSRAALQANTNTQYKKTDVLTNWVKTIRQMEQAGGAMGLNETLNTDYTSTTSNNIDVHCMRTTEYGAIAILSASGYGNPSNAKAITSTTGNNTGVILNTGKWEWTAGVAASSALGVDTRYFDSYTNSNTSAKVGDALGTSTATNPGCNTWHSASNYTWFNNGSAMKRGNGGIFAFFGNTHDSSGSYMAHPSYGTGAYVRGVAVCGEGL